MALFSLQSEQNLKFIMSHQGLNLRHLLLKDIKFNDKIENFISLSQSKLDMIYLWYCNFKTKDSICSFLLRSMRSIGSMHTGEIKSLHFTLLLKGHTTQVLCNFDSFFLVPNSPHMVHGLVLCLEQDILADLPLDSIFFLLLLPSETDPGKSSLSQFKKSLNSLMCRQWPKLECLCLNDMPPENKEEPLSFFQQFNKPKIHYL